MDIAQWSRTEKYMEITFSAKPIGFGALVSSEELLGIERGFLWLDWLLGWFFFRVTFKNELFREFFVFFSVFQTHIILHSSPERKITWKLRFPQNPLVLELWCLQKSC